MDEKVKLERNAKGEVVAWLRGAAEPVENVKVARCFPWSLGDEFISVRNSEGKEIVLLENLDGIDPQTRALIDQELSEKVFVPKIRRIIKYTAEFDVVSITADTDRGEVTFQIRNHDDVRMLSPKRALFRDVDGNIYEIEDFHALDAISRKHVERYF
jgi:hypothetical protein